MIVFDNKTFMMYQVSCPTEAFEYSFQPDPIDCGENIKLYRESEPPPGQFLIPREQLLTA